MPRHSRNGMYPIRSDFEADREVRRQAAEGALGVNRAVSLESAQDIRQALSYLSEMVLCETTLFPPEMVEKMMVHRHGERVAEPVDVRRFFSLTIVQKNRVSSQFGRIFQGGYELGRATRGVRDRTSDTAQRRLQVPLLGTIARPDPGPHAIMPFETPRKVSWRGQGERTLAIMLEPSDEIRAEHDRTIEVLGNLGLKNLDPARGFVEHVGLGQIRQKMHFGFDQKRAIADVLEETLPDRISFEPLSISTAKQTQDGKGAAGSPVVLTQVPPLAG